MHMDSVYKSKQVISSFRWLYVYSFRYNLKNMFQGSTHTIILQISSTITDSLMFVSNLATGSYHALYKREIPSYLHKLFIANWVRNYNVTARSMKSKYWINACGILHKPEVLDFQFLSLVHWIKLNSKLNI